MSARELGSRVLRGVSRSFYLSLRLLPRGMRAPLSLAYLLARTSDTIADTETVPREVRIETLREFRALVGQLGDAGPLAKRLADEFSPRQTHEAERTLLRVVESSLDWLRSMPPPDREAIQALLGEITEGQRRDLERFPGTLATAQELDDYTYSVAGSVGAFWTRMGFAHQTRYATESEETMRVWGVGYGKGLQLVNILRDLPKDLAEGRCYLPAEEVGATLTPEALERVARRWEEVCSERFRDGLQYCQALRSFRLRVATSLPVFLGVRTLALLRGATWEQRQSGLKISRPEVRSILRRTSWACLRGPKAMAALDAKLRAFERPA